MCFGCCATFYLKRSKAREYRNGFPPGRVEARRGIVGRRFVQRAIKLASPSQVVRGGGFGTSVPHLHGNDQRIHEGVGSRQAAGDAGFDEAARADFGGRGISAYARGAPGTRE